MQACFYSRTKDFVFLVCSTYFSADQSNDEMSTPDIVGRTHRFPTRDLAAFIQLTARIILSCSQRGVRAAFGFYVFDEYATSGRQRFIVLFGND